MQASILCLLALIAPLPAAAFGDMDCIALESCQNGQCSAATDPFAVTFDWSTSTVAVDLGGTSETFALTSGGEGSGDIPDTDLEYGDIATGGAGLLVVAEAADDILAYYAQSGDPLTLRTGVCDLKEAA